MDQKALARTWETLGVGPIFDLVDDKDSGVTRAATPDEQRFKPLRAVMASRLVRTFFGITSECSRGEYDGRPSPRDFDYLMDREDIGARQQETFRALLRTRNLETDAIGERRRERNKAARK
ncbi:MAG: hypothetical protein O7A04_07620 [Acidobacteria bacterium]|nr:hypothetical protein [Acidobacteriota bacterium]